MGHMDSRAGPTLLKAISSKRLNGKLHEIFEICTDRSAHSIFEDNFQPLAHTL
jgi:hypothetical protein